MLGGGTDHPNILHDETYEWSVSRNLDETCDSRMDPHAYKSGPVRTSTSQPVLEKLSSILPMHIDIKSSEHNRCPLISGALHADLMLPFQVAAKRRVKTFRYSSCSFWTLPLRRHQTSNMNSNIWWVLSSKFQVPSMCCRQRATTVWYLFHGRRHHKIEEAAQYVGGHGLQSSVTMARLENSDSRTRAGPSCMLIYSSLE